MWKCQARASGRVSISSCASMPAVGEPGDVADVVGAGAARAQPEILDAFEQG